jgi:two-component system sensor histidine kinase KdpD
VLLGAAPGVGKTYTMLEEGSRLAAEGRDVVVAVVETHGRSATASMLGGLEVVPRTEVTHRGVTLSEMDLEAVLERHPDVALVDELAHSNAPGSRNDKRWLDVETLLDAGIDVMTTVNIQHIESLTDVVEQITGARQQETVPDSIVRSAEQLEVVDLAPQALRDRLADGRVYPAARIDAALSNYFRLGNLTALRELALLWLADEVDSALTTYRADHGIASKWEARERVVVALTGGPEGETLLKRGARIAARSAGGTLVAVHVTSQDGLRAAHPGALAAQRSLVESLGGTFHQVVGDDIPAALVDFARGVNATQLVIGVSRRSRLSAALSGPGIGATVIRASGDIDVHIVTHAAAGGKLPLPRFSGSLTARRRLLGFALALVGGPLVTWLLVALRSDESITSDVLTFQLLVVLVALVGGIWPALFAALLSGLTLDFFFVDPLYTVSVGEPLHLLALGLYVVNAVLVSVVVDTAARRSRQARRAAAESELLATMAGSVLRGQDALQALVARTREAFRLTEVRLRAADGGVLAVSSVPSAVPASPSPAASADGSRDAASTIAVGHRATLELCGPDLAASERRLLGVIAAQLDQALEHRELAATASEVGPLAVADRQRAARRRRPRSAAPPDRSDRRRQRTPLHGGRTHPRRSYGTARHRAGESRRARGAGDRPARREPGRGGGARGVGHPARRRRRDRAGARRTGARAGLRGARHSDGHAASRARRPGAAAARARESALERRALRTPRDAGTALGQQLPGPGRAARRRHRPRNSAGPPRRGLRSLPAPRRHRQLDRPRPGARAVEGLRRGNGRNDRGGGHTGRRPHHGGLAARGAG